MYLTSKQSTPFRELQSFSLSSVKPRTSSLLRYSNIARRLKKSYRTTKLYMYNLGQNACRKMSNCLKIITLGLNTAKISIMIINNKITSFIRRHLVSHIRTCYVFSFPKTLYVIRNQMTYSAPDQYIEACGMKSLFQSASKS